MTERASQAVDQDAGEKQPKKVTLKSELRFYGIFFLCFLVFTTFGWGHYRIPSESMQPTLEVGDRLYVSKFAYGYSRHDLPFGGKLGFLGDGVINPSLPERGDVVVFRHPKSGIVMIKRAVGLPGDEIQYRGGRLYINGQLIERTQVDKFKYREHKVKYNRPEPDIVEVTVYEEQWPGEEKPHRIFEQQDYARLDSIEPKIVPEGTLFFIGDNRDNSTDSRDDNGPGFVPLDHVIGRAEMMVLSFKRCKEEPGVRCPGSRWFLKL